MVLPTDADARMERRVFFNTIFNNDDRGFICVALMPAGASRKMEEHFYQWPDQETEMLSMIDSLVFLGNVYFCPHLLKEKKRTKTNVIVTRVAWADLDTCAPGNMLLDPSI